MTHQGAQRTRRWFVLGATISVTGAAAGALAACGGATPTAQQQPAQDLKGTTVEYWNMWEPTHPEEVARQKVLDNFNRHNQLGITVQTATSAGQTAANMDKVVSALAAGTPPDLTNTFQFNNSLFFAKGGTVDVDAELKGNPEWTKIKPAIYPTIVKGLSWKGKLFAVPSHSSTILMYYNKAALDRAGLPAPPKTWTWDTFMDYGRKASALPDLTAYDCNWSYRKTGMLCLNNGVKFINDDGTRLQFDSPEMLQTLEWQLGLVKAGLMRPHDGRNGGYAELIPQNKVVFQNGVPARVPLYRRDNVPFGTCYYPLGPRNMSKTNFSHGVMYGFSVFKNKDPKRVQAALQAALWGARPESGAIFARDGGVSPSYRNILESADFQAEWRKDTETWPFFEALPNMLPYLTFPTFPTAEPLIDAQLRDIWAGKVSVRDGLVEAQRIGQQHLDEANRM
jgi:multiple sugar transport system substrate-binding protein